MNGLDNTVEFRAGLVIGIHKEELGFGQQVAERLSLPGVRVLQIDQGLPQRQSFSGKTYYYNAFHREIYMQIHQQVKNQVDLLIDLHTGINEQGRCADLFCRDTDMLVQFDDELLGSMKGAADSQRSLRLFEITSDLAEKDTSGHRFPACRTIIPSAVWKSNKYLYLGLEVYLPDVGMGEERDWNATADLVEAIVRVKQRY